MHVSIPASLLSVFSKVNTQNTLHFVGDYLVIPNDESEQKILVLRWAFENDLDSGCRFGTLQAVRSGRLSSDDAVSAQRSTTKWAKYKGADKSLARLDVPPRPPRRERSQRRKWELWARILSGNFAEMTTSTPFRDLLPAANLRRRKAF